MATKSFAGINLSGHLQDDELASWMGYPIDDYCSEILSELAGLEAMDDNVNQIKSPQKPVVNFSIFSRPIIEASPKIDLAFQEKNPEKDVASSSLCSKNEPGMKRREENGETEEDLTEVSSLSFISLTFSLVCIYLSSIHLSLARAVSMTLIYLMYTIPAALPLCLS